jgi:hypothetical protein
VPDLSEGARLDQPESGTKGTGMDGTDPLDTLSDAAAAAAFRRLVRHLRHRTDAQNIDLMGLAGFCRNCLADWLADAGGADSKAAARHIVYGMDYDAWRAAHQAPASAEQLARMEASVARNAR